MLKKEGYNWPSPAGERSVPLLATFLSFFLYLSLKYYCICFLMLPYFCRDKMLKKDAWWRGLQLAFCYCWLEKRPFIGNLSNSDANIVNNSNKFPIFTPIQPFQFS